MLVSVQSTPTFHPQLEVLLDSLTVHQPLPVQLYGYCGYRNPRCQLTSMQEHEVAHWHRPWIIKDSLEKSDRVMFLGADTELFGSLENAFSLLDQYDLVICAHWYGDEDKSNADFQLWRASPNTSRMLEWYERYKHNYPNEQECLSVLPHIFPNCLIWHQRQVNVAYYNVLDYGLYERNGQWFTQDGQLLLYHYSGFGEPRRMSRHWTGPDVTSDVLRFYERYRDKLAAVKKFTLDSA